MKIGISVKWTASAVLIVILVVCVYAFFTITDTQKSVELETARIKRIQYETLDELGAQTTLAISQPASGLLYDNDRESLTKLLAPVVDGHDNQGYFAVYATLIAPNRRVWATSVNSHYQVLKLAEADYFDRKREPQSVSEVDADWFKKSIIDQKLPKKEDIVQKLVDVDGHTETLKVREYIHVIQSQTGDLQGYLMIGYDIDSLEQEISAIQAQGEASKSAALYRSIWLAILAVIIGMITGIIQSLLITKNIKKLSKAASLIASGDLSVRSDVRARDEIGQLGDQFNVMADRVQALMQETEQKAKLEKEIDIARSIQSTLLPPTGFAECGPIQLNGFFEPASECGGDFWSYNRLADGSVLLTIGDVTGHGVPSAMITACAKSALDTLLNIDKNDLSLSQIVATLNIAICQAAKRTLFMTFLAMQISPDGRKCEVVNAGHVFPLLIHQNSVTGIVVRNDRLGDNENAQYQSVIVDLSPGDMIFMYTDGLTEYQNESGAEYGEKRLRKLIAPFGSQNVNDAMMALRSDMESFSNGAPQEDDITLMFAQIMR